MADESVKTIPRSGCISEQVKTLTEVRRERAKTNKSYYRDAILRVRRRCTSKISIILAVGISFASVLFLFLSGLIAGWLFDGCPLSTAGTASAHSVAPVLSELDVSNQLGSMAQTVGAVAGILFAVLVFAIQLQVDRSGQLAPLTKFLHRQSGMIMDTGIVIGLIAAMGIAQLLLAMGWYLPPNLTLAITLAEFLVALGLTLWHLVSMVVTATRSLSKEIIKAVAYEFDDLIDERTVAKLIRAKFEDVVSTYPGWTLEHIGFAWITGDLEQHKFKLNRSGVIVDIRLDALAELHTAIQAVGADWEATIAFGPGDSSEVGPVLVLRRKPERAHEADVPTGARGATPPANAPEYNVGAASPLASADRKRIEALVERVFEIRTRDAGSAAELGEVVATILESAEDSAIEKKKRELGDRLGMLAQLTELWHQRNDAASGLYELGSEGWAFWGFASAQRALAPVVRAAALSGDSDISEAVGQFLLARYESGSKRNDLQHMNEILVLINYLYVLSASNEDE